MLSAQRIRELLKEPNLRDAEALAIRDACRRWVEFAFEAYECSRAGNGVEENGRHQVPRDRT